MEHYAITSAWLKPLCCDRLHFSYSRPAASRLAKVDGRMGVVQPGQAIYPFHFNYFHKPECQIYSMQIKQIAWIACEVSLRIKGLCVRACWHFLIMF